MRPINEAVAAQVEAERQASNFACVEKRERAGEADDRDLALLRGRDQYGYDWDVTCSYAEGWYAAHTGWPHSFREGPSRKQLETRRAAFDQGFNDGGGDRADVFDVARRGYLAQLRLSNQPRRESAPPTSGRLLPSSFPKPSDAPRPALWSRRLIILSGSDIGQDDAWDHLRLIQQRPGADEAVTVILSDRGFVDVATYVADVEEQDRKPIKDGIAAQQLADLVAGREFDDLLVAVQEDQLALVDRIAHVLPLCRTMERTRNSKIQRRAHLRTWLDRGFAPGETVAAGHIRWGKVMQGRSAKLGEFTARHVGPASGRGQLVRIESADGRPATGYAGPNGSPLSPEIVAPSQARLKEEMARALRSFAAATRLMGAVSHR